MAWGSKTPKKSCAHHDDTSIRMQARLPEKILLRENSKYIEYIIMIIIARRWLATFVPSRVWMV